MRKPIPVKNPADIIFAFIEKINAHDVAGLCELMTEDHRFIDSLGAVVCGRENMRTGWEGYLNWFPDYQISIHEILQKDNFVALFGTARGTYCVNGKLLEANKWEIPAAWKAVIKNNLIAEWRVFADNSPVLQIMKTNRD
jgi:ketosteroid isomerase-like protein